MIETVRADHAPNPFGFKFITPLALGSTLNPINSTMLSTALVPITHSLHASVAEAGWLIAGLYLTSAVAQPTMGRLADLFGPRRVYLVSLLLVAAAGVFGRLASSLIALVLVRVLLGIGTSGAYPSAMRIFRVQADRYGLKPPRIAMGILSLAAISSTAIGPLIGGLLTGAYGWHSIFTVNLPLALITALLVVLWVPKDEQQTGNFAQVVEEVDMLGIGLFTFFLLSLMIFLMNLNHPLWLALLVAAVFCPALVAHSLRRDQPFIDVRMLMQNRPLSITYLRTTAVMMIVYCIFYGFAQWLESSVGLSSARAGLMTLPLSLVAAASSLLGVRTKSLHAPFLISIGSALIGCVCLLLVGNATPLWIIAAGVMFFGVPQGMFSTATQASVYIQASAEEIGTAAGLQRTASYLGAMAAASLLSLVYGQHATDLGLHRLAIVMGTLSAILFVATVFDRTIPSVASITAPNSVEASILPSRKEEHYATDNS